MTSIRGNYYFVSFIDDFSRGCWVYTMRHKGKNLELFVEWKRNMEKNTRKKIKIHRSENGDTQVILFYSYVTMNA